ncbi:MAG: type II toxin-antitoxin system ParD family antitoxin [Zoogloeaceae bacterium]|nr:type II toxin-antitoxin system ParD family antitoxin [Zoogloeaceae bacterium]
MSTMNISLPEELKDFVDQQVAARAYGSASEYVRELLRRERDVEHLRGLLLEGLESGPGRVADTAYFDGLRERIRQHGEKPAAQPADSAAGTARRRAKAGAR